MTSTYSIGSLSSLASLLSATLYQGILIGTTISGISDHWYIYIYIPYTDAAGMLLHINGEFTMEKLKSSLSFLATQIEKYPGGDHSNVTCYYRQHICPVD